MTTATLTRAEAQRRLLAKKVAAVNAQNQSFNEACEAVSWLLSRFVGQKIAHRNKNNRIHWVEKTGIAEMLGFDLFEEGPLCTVSVIVTSSGGALYLEHSASFEIGNTKESRDLSWCIGTCNTEPFMEVHADGVLQQINDVPNSLRTDWTVDEVLNLRNELDYAEFKATEARANLAEFCR